MSVLLAILFIQETARASVPTTASTFYWNRSGRMLQRADDLHAGAEKLGICYEWQLISLERQRKLFATHAISELSFKRTELLVNLIHGEKERVAHQGNDFDIRVQEMEYLQHSADGGPFLMSLLASLYLQQWENHRQALEWRERDLSTLTLFYEDQLRRLEKLNTEEAASDWEVIEYRYRYLSAQTAMKSLLVRMAITQKAIEELKDLIHRCDRIESMKLALQSFLAPTSRGYFIWSKTPAEPLPNNPAAKAGVLTDPPATTFMDPGLMRQALEAVIRMQINQGIRALQPRGGTFTPTPISSWRLPTPYPLPITHYVPPTIPKLERPKTLPAAIREKAMEDDPCLAVLFPGLVTF